MLSFMIGPDDTEGQIVTCLPFGVRYWKEV
jgi:hypothetical protein